MVAQLATMRSAGEPAARAIGLRSEIPRRTLTGVGSVPEWRMRRLFGVTAFSMVLVGTACSSEQDLRDDCPTANGACPACTADADCVIVSNPCEDSAYCTHVRRAPPLSVTQLGCNHENDKPPASRCGCVQGTCRSK